MEGCTKHSNNLFSKTPMGASEWIKKDHREMVNCTELYWSFQKIFVSEK